MKTRSSLFVLAFMTATAAHAQTAATATPDPATAKKESLQRVEVNGTPTDDAVRRASTAAKIVIGRDEIERYGDSTIGEVLKRLPGVTTGGRPGRGGAIRMRGMGGGYTQLLVNGERMPPGFSLDQLPPEQVERIEILRAPTAEYGARAIAGTINVVLREALQKRVNDLRIALSAERGQLRPNIGWTRNDKLDEHGGAYNLTVSAMQNERRDDVDTSAVTHSLTTQVPDSTLRTQGQSSAAGRGLHVNARLQWKLGAGDSLSIQPFFVANSGHSDNQFTQTITPAPLPGQPQQPGSNFDQALTHSSSRGEMLRVNSQWQHRLDEDTKLEVRGGVGQAKSSSHSFRRELQGGVENRNQDDTTDSRDGSWSLNSKLSRQLKSDQSLVGGIEGEGTTRTQSRVSLQNGLSRPELDDFGDNLVASTQRFAAYAQDEWSVGKQWAFYAGLRGETIATRSSAANYAVSNRSTVWTPLLHGVWKFDEKSRDQIRASLTRSYRSPNLNDLIARPSINPQYPCPTDQPCGPNEANYPDRIGNPGLKPELATGLELAYENYLSKGGILSANVFYRRISDLMRNVTGLEMVGWSNVPRWVSRPRNIGNATTMGLELEAKFRLDEFITDAWPVNVRSNLSLFHSRVDGIPGPNNTLDQQPRGTANLGFDYRLRSLPLSLGASLNYTPSTTIQQTLMQQSNSSRKVVSDAFALWVVNPTTQLRVSGTNLTPLNYATGSVITTPDKMITSESGGRTFTLWQIRLEIKV
jgi:iron complex outermembrane receptor protein